MDGSFSKINANASESFLCGFKGGNYNVNMKKELYVPNSEWEKE